MIFIQLMDKSLAGSDFVVSFRWHLRNPIADGWQEHLRQLGYDKQDSMWIQLGQDCVESAVEAETKILWHKQEENHWDSSRRSPGPAGPSMVLMIKPALYT